MKNKNIISSIVGAGFFAISYLAIPIDLIPSLLVGAASFVASELVISNNKKIEEFIEPTFKEKISLNSINQVMYDFNNQIPNEAKRLYKKPNAGLPWRLSGK